MKSPMQLRVCAKASPSCSLDSWGVESKLEEMSPWIKSSILINVALSGLLATPRHSKTFLQKATKSSSCWGKKTSTLVTTSHLSDTISICLSERRMRINLLTWTSPPSIGRPRHRSQLGKHGKLANHHSQPTTLFHVPLASSSMIRIAAVENPAAHQMPIDATSQISNRPMQRGAFYFLISDVSKFSIFLTVDF